ncbi:hypothetical protein MauCBS54593_001383 [Microsporum audouinii]
MPLHLLGKKSWNVYNKDNIARVRRDEARAKAEEEEKERKRQEDESEKRIDILRGKLLTPVSEVADKKEHSSRSREISHGDNRHRKRRRLAGENDTDRDIRLAKEESGRAYQRVKDETSRRHVSDAPIVDKSGHISLFPKEPARRHHSDKNPEAEAELAQKNREFEDQYTMRFSNAAGYKQELTSAPWYSSSMTEISAHSTGIPTTNVWGNEDPRRQEREKMRLATNDPLAAMKRGVKQLREVEKERTKWVEERERELRALKRDEKEKRRRRRHRSNGDSDDSLDGFRLDAEPEKMERKRHRSRSRDRDHRGERPRHYEQCRRRHSDRRESRSWPEKESVALSQASGKQYNGT